MMALIGRKIAVVQCSDPSMVGLRGVFALESMRTFSVVSNGRTRTVPKLGTVLRLQENGKIIVADEMLGRLEDRVAKGAKL